MSVPLRWALGVPLGLLGIAGSICLEGGHPQMLLHTTALLLVGGTVGGGLLALRGTTATAALLRTMLLGAPADPTERAARLRDVALLERLAMLGGCLGLGLGTTAAIGLVRTPERVGPALALAIVSCVVALLVNLLVALPLRQHLLQAGERLPARAVLARALHVVGVVLVLVAGSTFASAAARGSDGVLSLSVTPLLLTLAAILPSLLAAPATILTGSLSRARCQGFAEALWCAGALAAATGVMHVFSVLDQPSLLAPGVAVAFANFVLPAALAALVSLRGSLAPSVAATDVQAERSPYAGFALVVVAALAGMVLLVTLLLQELDGAAR